MRSATIFNVENQKYATNAIVTKFADIFYDVCWVAGFAIVKNGTNAQRVKLNTFFNVLVSFPLFPQTILWFYELNKFSLTEKIMESRVQFFGMEQVWNRRRRFYGHRIRQWIMVHCKWMANVGPWMFYHFIPIYG